MRLIKHLQEEFGGNQSWKWGILWGLIGKPVLIVVAAIIILKTLF
jgi:predicted cobalt transporter CbtA